MFENRSERSDETATSLPDGMDRAPDWQQPCPSRNILFVMHGEHSCCGRVGQLLRQKGYRTVRLKPRFGDKLPRSLSGYDGVVVFGGPMSCNDGESWIKDEIDLAGRACAEDTPYLGICLGAQMLAKALGATVSADPQERVEVGYYDVQPTTAGRSLGPWPAQVYHWHREGFQLPAGAQLLAQGGIFPNQAYAYGRAIGVQFHPEITYSLVHRWTLVADHMLALAGAQPADQHHNGHLLHARSVHQWLDRFLDRWLDGTLVGGQPAAARRLA